MAAKKKRKKTLASKTGVSQSALSRKVQIVRREDPSLSSTAASAKAAGILKQRKKKGK